MSTLISLSIDLNKIDKSKIYETDKGKYYTVMIGVNDEPNDWGKNCSVWSSQTKEERERNDKKQYIGSGKVVWTDGNISTVESSNSGETQTASQDDDDLPF